MVSCSAISMIRNVQIKKIKLGSTEDNVVIKIGTPVDREIGVTDISLRKYGSGTDCVLPCKKRLWYKNHLSPFDESWFIDIDASGHVIAKDKIVLP